MTSIKLKNSSHKTFYKNDIYIFVVLKHESQI